MMCYKCLVGNAVTGRQDIHMQLCEKPGLGPFFPLIGAAELLAEVY